MFRIGPGRWVVGAGNQHLDDLVVDLIPHCGPGEFDEVVAEAVEGATEVLADGRLGGGGVCGKLIWDSAKPPLFFWPLLLLDLALLWDAVRSFRQARIDLRRELKLEARVRELRRELGIDPRLSSTA